MTTVVEQVMRVGTADDSPFVGPRPFEREDQGRYFGREREADDLVCMIVANRATLLFASSGAGKTSLLKASVIPQLESDEFDVLPVARVRGDLPAGVSLSSVRNIYAFHTILCWIGDDQDPRRFSQMSLSQFLEERGVRHAKTGGDVSAGDPLPRILILDQFEELFTAYPERWDEREEFLTQLEDALAVPARRAGNESVDASSPLRLVIAMREDYIASLTPYLDYFPDRLRSRYHLESMSKETAELAISRPAELFGRHFTQGALYYLTGELSEIKALDAEGNSVTASGRFVEPVQLQVVCDSLWRRLPEDIVEIGDKEVALIGSVDDVLASFYDETILKACQASGVGAELIRKFFEDELITSSDTRGNVFRGPDKSGSVPNLVIDELERLHIIRAENRSGGRWYELTHDRLVVPIVKSNREWFLNSVRSQRETAITQYETAITQFEAAKGRARKLFRGAAVAILFVSVLALCYRSWEVNSHSQELKASNDELIKSKSNIQASEEKLRVSELRRKLDQSVAQIEGKQDFAAAYPFVMQAMQGLKALQTANKFNEELERQQLAECRLRLGALSSQLPTLMHFSATSYVSRGDGFGTSEDGNVVITFPSTGRDPEGGGENQGIRLHRLTFGRTETPVVIPLPENMLPNALTAATLSQDGRFLFAITAKGLFRTSIRDIEWTLVAPDSQTGPAVSKLGRNGLITSFDGSMVALVPQVPQVRMIPQFTLLSQIALVPQVDAGDILSWSLKDNQWQANKPIAQIGRDETVPLQIANDVFVWLKKVNPDSNIPVDNRIVLCRTSSGEWAIEPLSKVTSAGSYRGSENFGATFVTLSQDGRSLLTVDQRGFGEIFVGEPGRETRFNERIRMSTLPDVPVHGAFSRDGQSVAVGFRNGSILLWTLGRKDFGIDRYSFGREVQGRHTSWVQNVSWSNDGRYVASSGRDRSVRVWDVDSLNPVCPPLHHETSVPRAVLSDDCKYVTTIAMTGGDDPHFSFRRWDLSRGGHQTSITQSEATVFHAQLTRNGKFLLTFCQSDKKPNSDKETNQGALGVWNVSTAGLLPDVSLSLKSPPWLAVISEDGEKIVTVEGDETGIATKLCVRDRQGSSRTLDHAGGEIYDIAFGRKDAELAVAYVDKLGQAAVDCWYLAGNVKRSLPWPSKKEGRSAATRVTYAGNDYIIAAVDVNAGSPNSRGDAVVWHFDPQRAIDRSGFVSHDEGMITHVAADSRNRYFVTCSTDDTSCVWSLAEVHDSKRPSPKHKIQHAADVVYAVFSTDGNYLATAGFDGRAKLIVDATKGAKAEADFRLIGSVGHQGPVSFLAFDKLSDSDKPILLTSSHDGLVRLLGVNEDKATENSGVDYEVYTIGELQMPQPVIRTFPGSTPGEICAVAFPVETFNGTILAPMDRNRRRSFLIDRVNEHSPLPVYLGRWQLRNVLPTAEGPKVETEDLVDFGKLISAVPIRSNSPTSSQDFGAPLEWRELAASWDRVARRLALKPSSYDERWEWEQAIAAQSQQAWVAAEQRFDRIAANSSAPLQEAASSRLKSVQEARRKKDLQDQHAQASAYASGRQWNLAGKSFRKLYESLSDDANSNSNLSAMSISYEFAVCLKMLNQSEHDDQALQESRSVCGKLLATAEQSPRTLDWNNAAWLAALDRTPPQSWDIPLKLAKKACESDPRNRSSKNTLAAVETRSGNPGEAIRLLESETLLATEPLSRYEDLSDLLVLTLAYRSRKNDGDLERSTLCLNRITKARSQQSNTPGFSRGLFGLRWPSIAAIDLLIAELSTETAESQAAVGAKEESPPRAP